MQRQQLFQRVELHHIKKTNFHIIYFTKHNLQVVYLLGTGMIDGFLKQCVVFPWETVKSGSSQRNLVTKGGEMVFF